jgi:hypothetical protein
MDLDQLLTDAPPIHGDITHALIPQALQRIVDTVKPGDHTIETGSGHSTIAFALAGAVHTCIVPDQNEVDAIRAYCETHDVPLDTVTFHADKSELVLPALDLEPLDFALIDGSHSFPQVFIDWFYLADALKVGSTLIVDDIYVWTGRVLCDFLAAEPGWRAETELQGRSAVFVKTGDAGLNRMWLDQPYVARKTGFGKPLNKARQAVSMVRHGQAGDLVGELRRKAGR